MNKKTGIFYIGITLSIIVLAMLMRDVVAGKIIVPILEFIRVFDDLPQALLWIFAIAVILLFEWKSLIRWEFPDSRARRPEIDRRGRIEELADMIQRARRETYFRKKLAQYLADLTFATLAYRRGSTPKIMKERMDSGTLDIPPEMSAYFQEGYQRGAPSLKRRIRWAARTDKDDDSMKLHPAEVVAYLEGQLEVDDGRKDGYYRPE